MLDFWFGIVIGIIFLCALLKALCRCCKKSVETSRNQTTSVVTVSNLHQSAASNYDTSVPMSEIEVIEKKQKQHAFSSLKKKLNAPFVKLYIIKISDFFVLFKIIIDTNN